MKVIKTTLLTILAITLILGSLTSCEIVNNLLGDTTHTHSFTEGKCECGESDPSYTPTPEHTHNFVEGKCECGESDPNHTAPHVHNYESVVTEPTCTDKGYTTYTCSCGDIYIDEIDVIDHSYTLEVTTTPTCSTTGFGTYTCSCGDSYDEELPIVEHIDTNLDITCDFEGCTKRILPAADSKISLFTARHMIIVSISNNYYVEGVVTDVRDAKNGIFVITDEAGESILIRMPNNADGISYANWTANKVVLGDTVSVYGKPARNTTGGNTDMDTHIQSGVLTVVKHEHVFADADCITPATCACLATSSPALGHADGDNDNYCDRCEWNVKHEIETITIHFNDIKETENYNADEGTALWNGSNFSVLFSKGSGSFNTNSTTHIRWQQNNELTVSASTDKKIVSLVFVVSADSYVDEMQALLEAAGYDYEINGVEVTINVDPTESITIKNATSKSTRISGIKVVYEK